MGPRTSTVDAICAAYDGLSETEKRVGDFVLQNIGDVAHLSVREIASMSNTSGATVSRFVRHVGYDSLADLRLAIAAEQSGEIGGEEGNTVNEVSLDDIPASISYILENKIQELRATASLLDEKKIRKAVNLLLSSDNVLFAAVGNSIPVCSNLAFRLGQIGIRSNCPLNTESMILGSLSLRRNDLLVIVSSSGYSHRLETIVDNAEDSGTPIIMVTANPASVLAKRADIVLGAASREQMMVGTGGPQFATHVSEDFIVETLYMFVLAHGRNIREHARMEHKSLGRDKENVPTFS